MRRTRRPRREELFHPTRQRLRSGLPPGRIVPRGYARPGRLTRQAGGSSAGRSSDAHGSRLPHVSSAAPRSRRLPWVPGLNPARSVAPGLPCESHVLARYAPRHARPSAPALRSTAGGWDRRPGSRQPGVGPVCGRMWPPGTASGLAAANLRAIPGAGDRRPTAAPSQPAGTSGTLGTVTGADGATQCPPRPHSPTCTGTPLAA